MIKYYCDNEIIERAERDYKAESYLYRCKLRRKQAFRRSFVKWSLFLIALILFSKVI